MGKDKKTTQNIDQTTTSSSAGTDFIDPESRQFIENFLRPIAERGVRAVEGGGPLFGGLTDTFREGVDNLRGVDAGLADILRQSGGLQGRDFSGGLGGFDPRVGDGGASGVVGQIPGILDDARARAETTLETGGINFNARSFNPNDVNRFLSPFEDQVVGSIQQNADRQREQALSQAASEATGAGAFGGSRSGILQATALRDVNQDEAAQIANLRNQGFQNAQRTALGAFQGTEANRLAAARAAQQGRLTSQSDLSRLGLQGVGLGLEGARIGQAGDIAENELRLRRGQALQAGDIASGDLDARALGLGLNTLGSRAGLADRLLGAGETERQVGNQQRQEELFRFQRLLELANAGFGGPTGRIRTQNSRNRTRGSTTTIQEGDLFGDLVGAASVIGGLGGFDKLKGLFSNQTPSLGSRPPSAFTNFGVNRTSGGFGNFNPVLTRGI